MTATFIAPDISCGGCAAGIKKALDQQSGIKSVLVDVTAKTVTVQADDATVSREQIAATLTGLGYPPKSQ
jgi:copper chaperone CopZ